jgi:preprotein translocase subunit SecY
LFGGNSNAYWVLYFLMVVFFTFFYTNVLFQQQNYGDNLKRVGARIPGVSPGVPTQRYMNKVLSRVTFPGAFFLGVIAILPWLLSLIFPFMQGTSSSLLISGAGLLIVVGVVRDLFFNIEAELKLHGYDDVALIR